MTARLPGRHYSIHNDTMQAIADAVRFRTGSTSEMTPAGMIAELNSEFFEAYDLVPYFGVNAGDWTRPEDWPDLDSLNMTFEGDESFVYMTYDADKEASAIAWHIETADSTQAAVDIGHIEGGAFIADQNFTVNHNSNLIEWLDDYSGYIVVRITGKLSRLYSIAAAGTDGTQAYRQQPVLERIAYVPTLTAMVAAAASNAWGLWTLERDKVVNGDGSALTNIASMYAECASLRSLDLSAFCTPNVTTMASAFDGCYMLRELDLRHFVTEKVTTFANMFKTCYGMNVLDLTGWDTGAATTLSAMFQDCRRITEIRGLEDFDTGKVTTFADVFHDCRSIKALPISGWNTEKVTTLANMFYDCYSLIDLDLHQWDVSLVTNMSSTFYYCHNLKRLNLSGWETGALTTIYDLFAQCHSLPAVDISGINITAACTNINSAFQECWSLRELTFPEWDVSGLGNGNNTGNSIFSGCYSLKRIEGVSDWKFQFTNSMTSMFRNCRSLESVDVSGWTVDKATSLASMFEGCRSLKYLDPSGWDPENATTLASMFNGCWSLRSIGDISGWNTAKVTTMASMFAECYSLEEISDLSSWNVEKVTTLANMFSTCTSLREITIKDWNLAACTTILTMFRYCYSLKKIDFSGWSLPRMTSTAPGVFLGDCWNLRDVYPSAFKLNHSYANDRMLTHESLVRILEALPSVSGKTLNLSSYNIARLSAAEKAIATGKGWTLAN